MLIPTFSTLTNNRLTQKSNAEAQRNCVAASEPGWMVGGQCSEKTIKWMLIDHFKVLYMWLF